MTIQGFVVLKIFIKNTTQKVNCNSTQVKMETS